MVHTPILILLIAIFLVGTSSCKIKEINRPIRSSNSLGFYLSPLQQLDRLVSLDPKAPDPELLNGIEDSKLNRFIKPRYIADNKTKEFPSLSNATHYLKTEKRGGLTPYKINEVQKRLWIELDPLEVLRHKAVELVEAKRMIAEDNYGHYVVTRLAKEKNSVSPNDVELLFQELSSVSTLEQFETLLKNQYDIPQNYPKDFKDRFNVEEFDPEDILKNHGFRVDDPSPEYKHITRSLRDELLRYSKELSYAQKLALYQTIQDRIKTDDSLSSLRGQVLRTEAARKIPFPVIMGAMVENRGVFGPYIIKKIQQEYSRINSMGITLTGDVKDFLIKSQARDLSPAESEIYLQRAKELIPEVLGEGSRVLQAGSLGIVFENHENKIVKWVPDEVVASLLDDKAKYLKVIQDIDAGQGVTYPRDVIDAEMEDENRRRLKDEYRRRLRDEWQIKVDEIDEFLAETDLATEVENGEKVSSYNTQIREGNELIGEIRVIAGKNLDASAVNPKLYPQAEQRERIAAQFNIQEKASGFDLKWFNDPKNHSRISPNQRIQIQNSLQKLMDVHFQGMFSGNYFHGDLHEGNIRIELHEEGGKTEVKKISIIDLGTIAYLDVIERESLKGLFELDIAKRLNDDPDLIEKILYFNYSSLPDEQRQVLIKRDGFDFSPSTDYKETEIKELDTKIKYYMTGLSKQGFNLSVDGFKLEEFRTFLEIFKGKPVPNDYALRLLGLRSNVVALFKATSTGAGVVHASNLRAKNYISTANKPKQLAQKSVANFLAYLGEINTYSLEPHQAELLVDQSQMGRTRAGITEDMLDYIEQRRKRGVSVDASTEAVWRDIFEVENDKVAMQSELEQLIADRQVLSEQIEDLKQSNAEELENKAANASQLDELQKQLQSKDKSYKESLSAMENRHSNDTLELQKKISAMEAGKLASDKEINDLKKYVQNLQLKQAEYQKAQNEYAQLQETNRGLETKLRNLAELGDEKEILEQTNRQLQANNEELEAKQRELIATHEKDIDSLRSKLEADLANRDNKIRVLQETQRNLSKTIQNGEELLGKSSSIQADQLSRIDKLNEELSKVHRQLRKMVVFELENNRMQRELQELSELREKNKVLNDRIVSIQSENSDLMQSISKKDAESSKLLSEINLLKTRINSLGEQLRQSPTEDEINKLTMQLKTQELELEDAKTALANRPKTSDVTELSRELAENQEKIRALKGQIIQLTDIQRQLETERKFTTQIRKDLKTKEEQLEQVNNEMLDRQNRLDQLSQEMRNRDLQAKTDIDSLKKELETVNKQTSQLEETQTENVKLQEQIGKNERKTKLLTDQLQKLKTDYQESRKKNENELNQLKQELQSKAESEGVLKQKILDLENQLQTAQSEFAEKEKGLQSEKQKLESELRELNEKLSLANKDSLGKQKKIQKLQAKLYKAEKTLEEFNDMKNQLSDAQVRLKLLQEQDSNLRESIAGLEQERDNLRQINAELTDQLSAANSDIASMKQEQLSKSNWDELKARLEESEAKNKKLAEELVETKNRNTSLETKLETTRAETTKIAETPKFQPQRTSSVINSPRYRSPVTNINRHTTHVNKAAFKGLGALYFGIGASLLSSGTILINEGVK